MVSRTSASGGDPVIAALDIVIPQAALTVIVGPNGCGKSTLLHTLGRLLKPQSGDVILSGKDIRDVPTSEIAKTMGLLPQMPLAPDGVMVRDLIMRGRYPHRRFLRPYSGRDTEAVERAMLAANVAELAEEPVDALSGGQKQRVWIAMVLAQETSILLLDEPTSYLDIAHQVEILELFSRLRDGAQRTVVTVLHDLNHASRYADNLIVLKEGIIIAEGQPGSILKEDLIREVFGLECVIISDPVSATPMIVPGRPKPGKV